MFSFDIENITKGIGIVTATFALVGGGSNPMPGEISLAHHGVLFLDELPEFKRTTIDGLRQPLEDGNVTISRAKDTLNYPAQFILVGTKNPCPCGYYGSDQPCTCTAVELLRYQKKLSGPILDRIDMHVTVDTIKHDKLLRTIEGSEGSAAIKERVERASRRQSERLGAGKSNSTMSNKQIKRHVHLAPETKKFLDQAAEKLEISARVYMKTVKLAQTIADLDAADTIDKKHIAEALQYRPLKDV